MVNNIWYFLITGCRVKSVSILFSLLLVLPQLVISSCDSKVSINLFVNDAAYSLVTLEMKLGLFQ